MLTTQRRKQLQDWQGVKVRLHVEPELNDEETAYYNEDAADMNENIARLRAAKSWWPEIGAAIASLGWALWMKWGR